MSPDPSGGMRPAAVLAACLAAAVAMLLLACGPGQAGAAPPTGSAAAALTPVPGGPSLEPFDGAQAVVRAEAVAFAPDHVTLPAGQALRLVLDNRDQGIPHNIVVTRPGGTEVAKSDIVVGPGTAEVTFGPLAAGRYAFTCQVHPNMTGTLDVGP